MSEKVSFPYIHGFSDEEQKRLLKQSRFTEHLIYSTVDFSTQRHIVEIGSGIGAQTGILLRRFPDLKITCVERSDRQLAAAQAYLATLPYAKGRYSIEKMDASNLTFDSGSFDGAFVCWVLEHVPDPKRVLAEIRRVLHRGSCVYMNEVMNSSMFLDPYSPHTWKYWMAFNDFQHDNAGDPFIGAKLGNLLLSQGYQNIETKIKIEHFDNRSPQRRKEAIRFLKELLLSASNELVTKQRVDTATVAGMKKELDLVEADPNAVYFYAFTQAYALT